VGGGKKNRFDQAHWTENEYFVTVSEKKSAKKKNWRIPNPPQNPPPPKLLALGGSA